MEENSSLEEGQTLIEMVFILGVSFLILTGLAAAVIFSIKAARFAKNKAVASRLAREKIEDLKSAKQRKEFWEDPTAYGCGETESASQLGVAGFSRQTECGEVESFGGGEKMKLALTVKVWWQGGAKSEVSLSTYLTNWED